MLDIKQLKIVLPIVSHHSVFIYLKKREQYISFVESNLKNLKLMGYYVMMPSVYEIHQEKQDIIYKFSSLLKDFVENSDYKTIITCDIVLDALIKEDKRESFFKFLMKKNKKIILFSSSESPYHNYVSLNSPEYIYHVIEQEQWESSLDLFNRFRIIKEHTVNSYNPFKNPLKDIH